MTKLEETAYFSNASFSISYVVHNFSNIQEVVQFFEDMM